jgi:hypothetical protein
MSELLPKEEREKRIKAAHTGFRVHLFAYIVVLVIVVWLTAKYFEFADWVFFGWVIGAVYVFIVLYYFHDNYLIPYIKDLCKGETIRRRNIHFWMLQWTGPVVAIQLFVFVGFWMTVQSPPYADNMYTNPYLYGQAYKRLEGYLQAEVTSASVSRKLEDIDYAEAVEQLENRAKILNAEFSGYLNEKNLVDLNKTLAQDGIGLVAFKVVSHIYLIPFFIALSFGFLGALMYSLNDTAYRFFTSDLYPKTLVSYLIRFLFAPAICMVVAYYLKNDWWTNGAPIVFFLIGFFPQVALRYIEDKVRVFTGLKREEKQEIPLGLIQGMTDYIIFRFQELGVGDAQNLAYSDLNYLRNNWSNDRQLCDFVAQALLLIHLKEHFQTLQNAGIRNIISFKKVIKDDDACKETALQLNIPVRKLKAVQQQVVVKPLDARIQLLENIMNNFENKEQDALSSMDLQGV